MQAVGQTIHGAVLHVDRFGNVVTTIGPATWHDDELILAAAPGRPLRFVAASATVQIAGQRLRGIHHTFADAEPGALLALVGSHGHLEVAERNGDAARRLNVQPGDPVILEHAA
jgi:hypothetical protein